jgi:hypothetical protein
VSGHHSAQFRCTEPSSDALLFDGSSAPSGEYRMPTVTSDLKCEVVFGQLPIHTVSWESEVPLESWVRDLGTSIWKPCTVDMCTIRDEDGFRLTATQSVTFTCTEPDSSPPKVEGETGDEFVLGSVENDWKCVVRRLPSTPKQFSVSWSTQGTGEPFAGRTIPGQRGVTICYESPCIGSEGDSVSVSAGPPHYNANFECRAWRNGEPLDEKPTYGSGSTIQLPPLAADWRCVVRPFAPPPPPKPEYRVSWTSDGFEEIFAGRLVPGQPGVIICRDSPCIGHAGDRISIHAGPPNYYAVFECTSQDGVVLPQQSGSTGVIPPLEDNWSCYVWHPR